MGIVYKRPSELEIMGEAGAMLYEVHDLIAKEIEPGVPTSHLDAVAAKAIARFGAKPTFLGYRGYPYTIQTSINEVIVHGMPGSRKLKEGDLLKIDTALTHRGFVADSARSYPVGKVSTLASRLVEVTDNALWAGISACQVGNRLGDVSNAIQRTVETAGFSVVREFVGHGVGREMHEDPQVQNWGNPGKGLLLKPGLSIAIEPMVTVGKTPIDVLQDGWTARTRDGSLSAQVEHTIAITDHGPRVLTLPAHLPHGPMWQTYFKQAAPTA